VTALNLEALQVMKRGTPHLLLSSITPQQATGAKAAAAAGMPSIVGSAAPGSTSGTPGPASPAVTATSSPSYDVAGSAVAVAGSGGQQVLPAASTVDGAPLRQQGLATVQHAAGQLVGSLQEAAAPAGASAASLGAKQQVKVVREVRAAPTGPRR
jgi:hypothetical protein